MCALQELLHHAHRIEVPVKCLEGRLYVRLSAHVYNHLEEYARLATAIRKMSSSRVDRSENYSFI